MERLAGRVILLWGWRRALAAFLAGAFAALAQPPFDFLAACFVSFPVLVWLIDGAAHQPGEGLARRALRPFLIGWWFGFGYFLAGLWWTGAALLVEAELFAWALPFAVLGLPALLAAFYGLAVLLARLAWSDGAARIAALAAGFAAAEWLRGVVLTGFPWNAIGQAAMPVPLMMQSVGVVSMVGINALAVFVFSAPALFAARRGRASVLAVALAAVVGKPDPLRTEIVKAYVVLKPGVERHEELAGEISLWVRERLSAHEYPREVEFVDSMPLTTTGKVIRRIFRDRARAEAG